MSLAAMIRLKNDPRHVVGALSFALCKVLVTLNSGYPINSVTWTMLHYLSGRSARSLHSVPWLLSPTCPYPGSLAGCASVKPPGTLGYGIA